MVEPASEPKTSQTVEAPAAVLAWGRALCPLFVSAAGVAVYLVIQWPVLTAAVAELMDAFRN